MKKFTLTENWTLVSQRACAVQLQGINAVGLYVGPQDPPTAASPYILMDKGNRSVEISEDRKVWCRALTETSSVVVAERV